MQTWKDQGKSSQTKDSKEANSPLIHQEIGSSEKRLKSVFLKPDRNLISRLLRFLTQRSEGQTGREKTKSSIQSGLINL